MGVFAGKRFADWTTRFGFVVMVERAAKDMSGTEKLSHAQKMGCSLLGGTLSALVTVPIDVTVAMIQQASKKGVFKNCFFFCVFFYGLSLICFSFCFLFFLFALSVVGTI